MLRLLLMLVRDMVGSMVSMVSIQGCSRRDMRHAGTALLLLLHGRRVAIWRLLSRVVGCRHQWQGAL